MKLAYYDYSGMPAKLILDENQLPVSCEVYDRATNAFVARDQVTADLWHGSGAPLISEDAFKELLAKVRRQRAR